VESSTCAGHDDELTLEMDRNRDLFGRGRFWFKDIASACRDCPVDVDVKDRLGKKLGFEMRFARNGTACTLRPAANCLCWLERRSDDLVCECKPPYADMTFERRP
jgi:hypothetical protein